MEQNVVLEMRDISKNFTGVRALSHVDFTLRKGEIHALMGENGAGKSTLIYCTDTICLRFLRRVVNNGITVSSHMNCSTFKFMYTGQHLDQC